MKPDFDELLGAGGAGDDELAELRNVHELLLSATPAPVLPRRLRRRPRPPRDHRSRFGVVPRALLAGAAAFTAIAFGVGYELGHQGSPTPFRAAFTRTMHGLGADRGANATIAVGGRDGDGNWPLAMTVTGLPRLARGGFYQLYLTRRGKPELLCGDFRSGPGEVTSVRLNAPGELDEYSGWIVTARVGGRSSRALLTT
jgi:hypothetical protein